MRLNKLDKDIKKIIEYNASPAFYPSIKPADCWFALRTFMQQHPELIFLIGGKPHKYWMATFATKRGIVAKTTNKDEFCCVCELIIKASEQL